MLTVHLRINDSATSRPTPVRVRVSGADGTHYAPFGHVVEFPAGRNEDVGGHVRLGTERWFYIDGACEIRLPAGEPLRIQAAKGPEFRPLDQTVTLGPGQMALRFAVERVSHCAAAGWVAGESRSHFVPPHAALLEAMAEDLAFVNLLACVQRFPSLDGTAYATVPNVTAFSGQNAAIESAGSFVAVNTLNVHPSLGRVGLLHSHRPVYPLTFGGDEDTDDWSLCDWCDQCHRKNGLTVWVDAFRPQSGLLGGEALVALVLGKIDALEIDAFPRVQPLLPWVYRIWNAGFPVPLVGGSGKDSNRVPLGSMRTYAHVPGPEPATYAKWVEAVRGGRTFVTNGPLLSLSASGHGPGAAFDFPTDDGPLRVVAAARSLQPFDKLELIADGQTLAADAPRLGPDGLYAANVAVSHAPEQGGWIAARCWSAAGSVLDPLSPTFAHTSPIFIRPAGKTIPQRKSAIPLLKQAIERCREWVVEQGRFASEKRKQQLLGHHDRALNRLEPQTAGGEP